MTATPQLPPREGPGWTVLGIPGAPAVVLLHGVFFPRQTWHLVAERLADRYHVALIDLPGHGDLAATPFTIETAAAHVAAVLAELGLAEPVVVVGWSLGGLVAMELLAGQPSLARGLVLTGASFEPGRFLWPQAQWFLRVGGHLPAGPAALVARGIVRVFAGAAVTRELVCGGAYIPQGLAALGRLPRGGFAERLARYGGPSLLLNGARDPIGRSGQQRFAANAPRADVQLIQRAGHLAPVQQPEVFAAAVAAFCEALDAEHAPTA